MTELQKIDKKIKRIEKFLDKGKKDTKLFSALEVAKNNLEKEREKLLK